MPSAYYERIGGRLPAAASIDRAAAGMARWLEKIDSLDADSREQARLQAEDPTGKSVLHALFGNSPYLTQCALGDPAFAVDLFIRGPDHALQWALNQSEDACTPLPGIDQIALTLRQTKRRVALATALADMAGDWNLEMVTGVLSDFADFAVHRATCQLLDDLRKAGSLKLANDDPCVDSGFVVIGMGKLGARELNYSSDIDLIILYDQEVVPAADPVQMQRQFVRLTRGLVKCIDERTRDGYVFRVDLRLRPDPSSTPVAISMLAAETYYESIGQNWERAAMIKARPIAGDLVAGQAYLDRLQPFIWRKNLDFATINDIHSIKRQINAHRGGAAIKTQGHNLKLGRGGIREIEFFTQTQQLIWGGRNPSLRRRRTIDALHSLNEHGRINSAALSELEIAYEFLRRTEHRLQMVDDQQSQTLPESAEGLEAFAIFMGYDGAEQFETALIDHLRCVETHYADLFEDASDLSAQGKVQGNLVFTGSDPDPDTLKTLESLGFRNAEAVDLAVRGWHHARYRATSSSRARQILTELMPGLLTALTETADPDQAFMQFDQFLSRLPAGVQLFSMFHANPELLDLVAELMGTAPRLAAHLSRHTALLEGVLATDADDVIAGTTELSGDLGRQLTGQTEFEDVLDLTRRWSNDRRFLIGVRTLRGSLHPLRAAECYSDLADAAIGQLLAPVQDQFKKRHGMVPDSEMAVLAMGKLGSREMTPTSDLDLIFIYDTPGGADSSDGTRPLPVQQYYSRLSQRFINAITAPTAEGTLYEVDMRLRPSGNAGPIACSLGSFERYHHAEAWTWEHMALTRARPVVGSPRLRQAIERTIYEVLTRPRDPDKLLHDVAEMRRRMDKEHHTDFIWEVKHRRGGLVDIEFICQYLLLRHGASHPDLANVSTRASLVKIGQAQLLPLEQAQSLIMALDLWQTVQGILRLTIEGMFAEDRVKELSADLKTLLCNATSHHGFADLLDHMERTAETVYGLFRALIETPAGTVDPQGSTSQT